MQCNAFSDMDGIRIAAELERRGGEFYRLAARVCRLASEKELLMRLAEEEAVHLSEFQRLYEREVKRGKSAVCSSEQSALLHSIAADIAFPDGVVGIAHALDDPAAILGEAIRSEKDSIRFYEEMARATLDGQTAGVFMDIVGQEKAHLNHLQKALSDVLGKDGSDA